MTNAPRGSADRFAKVVLVGAAGVGKAAMVKTVGERYAHGAVRSGEIGEGKVFRTEFYWPEVLRDGGRLRVRLFAVSGQPAYNAVMELALSGAHGIVFCGTLAREQGHLTRLALQSMVFNVHQNDLDLASLPAALHYLKPGVVASPAHLFTAEEMDQWLGIPTGSVPRFVSTPSEPDHLRAPVEWVVAELARRADRPAKVPELAEQLVVVP